MIAIAPEEPQQFIRPETLRHFSRARFKSGLIQRFIFWGNIIFEMESFFGCHDSAFHKRNDAVRISIRKWINPNKNGIKVVDINYNWEPLLSMKVPRTKELGNEGPTHIFGIFCEHPFYSGPNFRCGSMAQPTAFHGLYSWRRTPVETGRLRPSTVRFIRPSASVWRRYRQRSSARQLLP